MNYKLKRDDRLPQEYTEEYMKRHNLVLNFNKELFGASLREALKGFNSLEISDIKEVKLWEIYQKTIIELDKGRMSIFDFRLIDNEWYLRSFFTQKFLNKVKEQTRAKYGHTTLEWKILERC